MQCGVSRLTGSGLDLLGHGAQRLVQSLGVLTTALGQVVLAAATAAEAGAAATEPLRATKGRASYLGERSIGHLDPGAVSTSLILRAAVRAAGEAGAA